MTKIHNGSSSVEQNINRVRNLLSMGLTIREICTTIPDLSQEEIFLAFHSALILLKDEADFEDGTFRYVYG